MRPEHDASAAPRGGRVGHQRYSPEMRVLYINPFSQKVCGPDESLLALLTRLIPRGIEAHVVLPGPGPQVDRYRALGAQVHYLPLSVLSRGMGLWGALAYPFRLGRGAVAVLRLARRLGVALIHSNMEVVLDGAIAARLLGVPHVFHYRGNTLDHPRPVFGALTAIWTALSGRVFCISEATATVFRKRGRGGRVEVLYNSLDLRTYLGTPRSRTVRAELGAEDQAPLIGAVGRIHPRKDLLTFVRASARVHAAFPSARFVIVGPAEAPAELEYLPVVEALARELGVWPCLCFAGARTDMAAVMKALDVLVLCSRHEGFGRVIAEGLAAGLPIVATREGALPELLGDGRYGLLAEPEDAEQFAAHIGHVLRDDEHRLQLSRGGPPAASRFDSERIATQVLSTYDALTRTVAPEVAR